MNLLPLCIAVVILAAVFYVACVLADDTVIVEPEQDDATDWLREPCDTTGCPCTGWIPATRRDDGRSVLVCSGDYADGQLRGWWK